MAIKIAGTTVINDSRIIEGLGSPLSIDQGGTGQISFTNGQLLIGNTTGNTLTKTTLTQGANITITNGAGSISIAAANTNLTATVGTTVGPTINSSTGTGIVIPSASATTSGIITTSDQTFAGVKTFNSAIIASLTGNASTATALQTARTINGVSFNGSANITIADSTKLPLTGGTLSGDLSIINSTNEMHLFLGSSGGYFHGSATKVGFYKSSGALFDIDALTGNVSTNGTITCIGQSFGSALAVSETDVSRHIALWGSSYGLSITNTTLNIISGSGSGNIKLHGNVTATGTISNLSSYMPITGGQFSGLISTVLNSVTTINTANDTTLSIRGDSTHPASMSFHRTSAYAVNFGLDIDNIFKLGGWSASTTKHNWTMSGDYLAVGNITAYYSDARLKDFHGKIPNAIDKICALNGYYFTENQIAKDLGYNNDRMQVGLSAQEVEQVLPEIVTKAPLDGDHDYKTIWYDKLIPLLVEAIKEQQIQIDQLKMSLNS